MVTNLKNDEVCQKWDDMGSVPDTNSCGHPQIFGDRMRVGCQYNISIPEGFFCRNRFSVQTSQLRSWMIMLCMGM